MREELKTLKAQMAELLAGTDSVNEPEEIIEGAAIEVPAAPAAKKARPRRKTT